MIAPIQSEADQPSPRGKLGKQSILDRLKGRFVEAPELPAVDRSRLIQFDDPIEHFQEMLRFVGGEPHVVESPEQVRGILEEIDVFKDARRIASTFPEAVQPTVDLAAIDDPHHLSSLDWTIVKGEFGVAENGSIWIDGATMPHRVMIFIAQYLAVAVSRREIVTHMHDAYERLGAPDPGFGIFVSGPSKTADIEQSLVLGAHGCRKLQVFLLP